MRFVEQRRRAFDVDHPLVGQIGEGRRGQPHRAGEQRVVQQPLFVDALEHRLARAVQRQPGELRVQVVGRLAQIVGVERLADVDHLLNHVAAARDDHDEHRAPR